MRNVALQRIEVDAMGRLLLAPAVPEGSYAQIYREANGLRWDSRENSFVAYEPERWGHAELAGHIARTLCEALSVYLIVTERTMWANVPPETEAQIREVLSASPV